MAEPQEGVTYEMLQDLLRADRRSNKLMPVPPRFWNDVHALLERLLGEFRGEQARDPFSRKVMLLTDTVKNARAAAESLWAIRERKLAMLALAAPKDRKKPDGLLPEESMLYARLVEVLDEGRSRVVAAFEGMSPPPAPPAPAATPPASAPDVPALVAAPSAPQVQVPHVPPPPEEAPAAPAAATVVVPTDVQNAPSDLVTIRALADIPPFVGPDMQTYLLKAGDIASVPPSIAQLLERRKKAQVVEGL